MPRCIMCNEVELHNRSYKYCRGCLAILNNESVTPTLQPDTKVCARCKEAKPLSEFYHYNGRPISYCRPCNKEYHYADHQKRSAKVLGRVAAVKEDLMTLGPQLRGLVIEAENRRRTKQKKNKKNKRASSLVQA